MRVLQLKMVHSTGRSPPMVTPNLHLHIEEFPLKKRLKPGGVTPSHQVSEKETTLEGAGTAKTASHHCPSLMLTRPPK